MKIDLAILALSRFTMIKLVKIPRPLYGRISLGTCLYVQAQFDGLALRAGKVKRSCVLIGVGERVGMGLSCPLGIAYFLPVKGNFLCNLFAI